MSYLLRYSPEELTAAAIFLSVCFSGLTGGVILFVNKYFRAKNQRPNGCVEGIGALLVTPLTLLILAAFCSAAIYMLIK
jgi:hypothetical protein